MNERGIFYQNHVLELIVDKKSSILVCGGGDLDKKYLKIWVLVMLLFQI